MGFKIITYENLIRVIFGEDEDYPDFGTPAYDIRESDYKVKLKLEIAEKVADCWGIDKYEWEDLQPNDEVEVTLSLDDILGYDYKLDFLCHFTENANRIEDGEEKRKDIEGWINERIGVDINYFNHFTMLGNWG